MKLEGRTLFVTGGSRGIGLAIAVRAAQEGANVVIAAKTAAPHPKLPGTIYDAAEKIEAAGGKALPLVLDVRDAEAIEKAVTQAAQHFGGIDACINNASAIDLSSSLTIETKRYDLMQQINVRGSFITSRVCIPHLSKSTNPHILSLSPPLNLRPDWFARHLPYTISKYGMSMVILGLAEELRPAGIGCNALWPRTTIATAAIEFVHGGAELIARSRRPEIMADAACAILARPAASYTGNFVTDEAILREEGVVDFSSYSLHPEQELEIDIFVEE